MTYRDSMAFSLDAARNLIEELTDREHDVAEARRAHNGQMRSEAESQAGQLRKQLLNQQDASNIYLYLSATGAAESKGFRTEWQQQSLHVDISEGLRQWAVEKFFREHWSQNQIDLTPLPACSFTLGFTFTLAQPYLSKDDNPFYIIDNPIVRDRVFRLPLVRPSSWKGSLRAALWQLGYRHDGKQYEQVRRLFGETRGDGTGRAGRLIFFPTFFTQTGLEIINPHDRVRRVGKNPILLECVPIGAQGTFTLLYVPFDRIGQDAQETRSQVAADLQLVTEGIQAMLTTYGFGAKTSSGFGVVEDRLTREGKLALKAGLADVVASAPPLPELPQPNLARYLESPTQLHADLRRPDGSPKPEAEYRALIESRGQKYTKKDRQLYAKAESWWGREGRELAEGTPQERESAPIETPPVSEYTFRTLSELCELAHRMATQLQDGGEA